MKSSKTVISKENKTFTVTTYGKGQDYRDGLISLVKDKWGSGWRVIFTD